MRCFVLLAVLALMATTSTMARSGPMDAVRGESYDSKAPLKINATEMVTEKKGSKILFKGNVVATKGKLTILTDEMTVWTTQDQREFQKIVARGSVKITREDKTASGDLAEYFNENASTGQQERIEISGNALLKDGRNSAKGEKVIYYFNTEDMRIEGGSSLTFFPEDSNPAPQERQPSPSPAPAPAATPAPPAHGHAEMEKPEARKPAQHEFTIQVASFQVRKDAEKLQAKLSAKGYHCKIMEANVKGGLWHRVRLDGFGSVEEASSVVERLRRDFGLKPIVIQQND